MVEVVGKAFNAKHLICLCVHFSLHRDNDDAEDDATLLRPAEVESAIENVNDAARRMGYGT